MIPENSLKQLHRLRKETKGKDIGDLTAKDDILPNLTYIGNSVDRKVDSYEEFASKDSQLQTVAFKSKLVNKPLVKENKNKIMENKLNNILSISDFEKNWKPEEAKKTKRTETGLDIVKETDLYVDSDDKVRISKYRDPKDDYDNRDVEPSYYEEYPEDDDHNFDKYDNEDDEREEREYDANDDIIEDEDILNFESFKESKEDGYRKLQIPDTEYDPLEVYKLNKLHKKRYAEEPEYKNRYDTEVERSRKSKAEVDAENIRRKRNIEYRDEEEKINRFSDFAKEKDDEEVSIAEAAKSKYEFLGKEEEPKSNPNFGYAAVRDQEIKKIAFFNNFVIDPPTPKERPVLNAGQFIDNDTVKGYVNRIEGKDVYVESLDEPMVIKKFSLKDAVKIKKEK